MITASWNNEPGDIKADLRRLREQAEHDTGWQPPPLIQYVSPCQFAFLLARGYITPDGCLTEEGNRFLGSRLVAHLQTETER